MSPAKGVCKCFSCGKGGNAVHFVMEKEQLSYYEALKFLAKKYHIEVKERELTNEEKQEQSERESMFVINTFARDYFQDILRNHVEGRSIGMAYFRQRGFRDDIIEKFQLGFCTDSKEAMSQAALSKGYKKEFLVKTGLCYETDDHRLRDRFWGRVIFPVHTVSGKVVAFGGRMLNSETKGVKMKYVNSPESAIYHKGNELYGIFYAKTAIGKYDKCYLVEGYTDVISMHQSGIENVVSSSGTALTGAQIRLIHRFTNNLTLLYDGDAAGIKASLKGIDMLLEEGMNIKVCLLPDGEDPDSYAQKHNSSEFQEFIQKNEVDFLRFKTNLLLEEAGKDPIKRAELIGSIVQSIAVIPEAIVRDVYIKECGQLLHIEDRLLVSEVAKRREAMAEKANKPTSTYANTSPTASPAPASHGLPGADVPPPFPPETEEYYSSIPSKEREGEEFYQYERLIIQAIVRYGEKSMGDEEDENGVMTPISATRFVADDLQADELSFHNPIHRRILAEALEHDRDAGFIAERYFIAHPDPVVSRVASELASDRYQLSKFHSKTQKIVADEERLAELIPALMTSFKNAIVAAELKHIMFALQDPATAENDELCAELMQRYKDMKEIETMMAKHLGDRVVLR